MYISFLYRCCVHCFFFFNDTATTEIYTLSLHDALPISSGRPRKPSAIISVTPASACVSGLVRTKRSKRPTACRHVPRRSEEHTSELQSRQYLVCRLLLEKKKNTKIQYKLYTR